MNENNFFIFYFSFINYGKKNNVAEVLQKMIFKI